MRNYVKYQLAIYTMVKKSRRERRTGLPEEDEGLAI